MLFLDLFNPTPPVVWQRWQSFSYSLTKQNAGSATQLGVSEVPRTVSKGSKSKSDSHLRQQRFYFLFLLKGSKWKTASAAGAKLWCNSLVLSLRGLQGCINGEFNKLMENKRLVIIILLVLFCFFLNDNIPETRGHLFFLTITVSRLRKTSNLWFQKISSCRSKFLMTTVIPSYRRGKIIITELSIWVGVRKWAGLLICLKQCLKNTWITFAGRLQVFINQSELKQSAAEQN